MINMTDDTHFTVTFGDLKGPVYIKGTSNNYQLIHLKMKLEKNTEN